MQRAKKELYDSQGLVDFAIRLVNFVLNLPNGQVKLFEEFKLQKNCLINPADQKVFGLDKMAFGLVRASYSLPKWQAVQLTFLAPWHDFNHTDPSKTGLECTSNIIALCSNLLNFDKWPFFILFFLNISGNPIIHKFKFL